MFARLIRAAPLARRALSTAAAAAPRVVPRAKLAAAAVVGTVAAGTVAFAACAAEREWVHALWFAFPILMLSAPTIACTRAPSAPIFCAVRHRAMRCTHVASHRTRALGYPPPDVHDSSQCTALHRLPSTKDHRASQKDGHRQTSLDRRAYPPAPCRLGVG